MANHTILLACAVLVLSVRTGLISYILGVKDNICETSCLDATVDKYRVDPWDLRLLKSMLRMTRGLCDKEEEEYKCSNDFIMEKVQQGNVSSDRILVCFADIAIEQNVSISIFQSIFSFCGQSRVTKSLENRHKKIFFTLFIIKKFGSGIIIMNMFTSMS